MSTEAAVQGAGRQAAPGGAQASAWTSDPRTRRVLRFSFGLTLAAAVAFAFEWPLYFLTPVLTSTFLTLPLPPPTLRRGLVLMGYVAVGFLIGLGFTAFLLRYPLIYIPVLGLVLFHLYYLVNRGGPILFVLMTLLAVLILPMLAVLHGALAFGFTNYFVLSGVLAVGFYMMAYGFFPEPGGQPPAPAPKGKKRGYSPVAAQAALKSTVAILPLAILFIAGSWTSEVLVLVFAAIFSLSPELSKGRAAAIQSLLSTLLGGVVAIIFYNLIVAVPEFHFFVLLMFATTLSFGMGIYSGRPMAKYLPSAVAALIVLVTSSMGEGGSLGGTFMVRVLLIGAASVYVVAVMALFERFWPRGN